MMNVCFQCGKYRPDKRIDPSGPYAICPECGYQHRFIMSPLLVVSGASGTGKTAICQSLQEARARTVLLDSDIIWRPEFDTPQTKYRDFFETWLRICKNISQSGRPVTIFGAGFGVPENIEPCVERRYFSRVDYLALVCTDELLIERLRNRPAWRCAGDHAYIEAQLNFNHWFITYSGQPPITLLDTSSMTIQDASRHVADWIKKRL